VLAACFVCEEGQASRGPAAVVLESSEDGLGYDGLGDVGDGCRKAGLSPEERLRVHPPDSGPVMEALHAWMTDALATKRAEPNSGLGHAYNYMLKRFEQRVDLDGVTVEHVHPIHPLETIGQPLRLLDGRSTKSYQ
jgi:hypothetical protein